MSKKLTITCVTLLVACSARSAFSQDTLSGKPPKHNITFLGDFAVFFSSRSYLVQASPGAGWWLTENFLAGGGISILATRYQIARYLSAGPYAVVRYHIFRGFFLHASPQLLYTNLKLGTQTKAKWVPVMLVGVGGVLGGGRAGAVLTVLYDLVQDPLSPYYTGNLGTPVVIQFGLIL